MPKLRGTSGEHPKANIGGLEAMITTTLRPYIPQCLQLRERRTGYDLIAITYATPQYDVSVILVHAFLFPVYLQYGGIAKSQPVRPSCSLEVHHSDDQARNAIYDSLASLEFPLNPKTKLGFYWTSPFPPLPESPSLPPPPPYHLHTPESPPATLQLVPNETFFFFLQNWHKKGGGEFVA